MLDVDYSKPFLPFELIKKVFELAGHGIYTPDSLTESSSKLIGVRFDAVHNSVALLISAGLVTISAEGYCNNSYVSNIHDGLIEYMSNDGSLNVLASAIEGDDDLGGYKVNHFKLFPKYRGLITLGASLNIFSFDVHKDFYKLTESGLQLLGEKIFESSFNLYDDGITPAQLNARLAMQVERGDIAEEFVLRFERRRLSRHPYVDVVKRISLSNVSAGFDIQSFNTEKSTNLDRFIEVKSFMGSPGFYWSLNEINVAKEKGESYSLYIVDSAKMEEDDYEPSEIRNPYSIFNMNKHIPQKSSGTFNIEPQSFYISWKNNEHQ
jgi:hypothetical protein